MFKNKFTYRLSALTPKTEITSPKKEFISFVGDQFKQLVRKNLGVPVKLYHL